jgi:hypothetical protein
MVKNISYDGIDYEVTITDNGMDIRTDADISQVINNTVYMMINDLVYADGDVPEDEDV